MNVEVVGNLSESGSSDPAMGDVKNGVSPDSDSFQMFAGFAELADMLGATRFTVKGWYRYDPSFPKPVGAIDGQPAFNRESVQRWWSRHLSALFGEGGETF